MTGVLEIMNEDAKVEQVGQIWNKEENPINGRIYSQEGISPTLMTPTGGSFEPKILLEEPNVINPLKGKTDKSWFFEQQVYDVNGIARAIKSTEGSGNEPKILLDMENPKSCASRQRGDKHKLETRKDDVANCVTSIDTDSMVAESQVIGSMQKNAYKGSVEGVAPCINAAAGMGGGHVPMLQEPTDPTFLRYGFGHGAQGVNKDMAYAVKASAFEANNFIVEGEQRSAEGEPKMVQKVGDRGTDNYSMNEISNTIPANPMSDRGQVLVEPKTRYRIRKLTEREVFRLMDVSEEDIDKIQAAEISKTAQYRLAGNSIVVSCLYHLFRKMFVQTECETQQLSLF